MEGFPQQGFREFYLALGYKGEEVKRYSTEQQRPSQSLD